MLQVGCLRRCQIDPFEPPSSRKRMVDVVFLDIIRTGIVRLVQMSSFRFSLQDEDFQIRSTGWDVIEGCTTNPVGSNRIHQKGKP